jgi:hypothetical protein
VLYGPPLPSVRHLFCDGYLTSERTDHSHPSTPLLPCRYKQPLALVGMVLTAKAWDWLRSASASMDTTAPPYRALYAAVTIRACLTLRALHQGYRE